LPKKKRVVQARHRARELAAQLLYSLEIRPEQDLDECLNAFIKQGFASNADMDEDIKDYMFFLVKEVWRARLDIDDIMRRVVIGWRLERMVAVDRAVLRVAIFEGFIKREIPVAVAISEAVELARVFGTEASGRFVNGVLAKVLQFMKNENRDGDKKDGAYNDKSYAASTSKDSTDS
jgi:N utilization substance protein B